LIVEVAVIVAGSVTIITASKKIVMNNEEVFPLIFLRGCIYSCSIVLINIEFGLLLRIEVYVYMYFHLQIHLNFQLYPIEPANYRGSYTKGSKEIVDIEIAMY